MKPSRYPYFFAAALAALLAVSCGTGRHAQWEATQAPAAGQPATAATNAPDVDHLAEAKAGWQKRGDRSSLESAIAHWETAFAAAPNDAALGARLSRAYYFLGEAHFRTLGPKDARYLGAFEKGTAAGERALAAASPTFKARVLRGDKVEDAIGEVGPEAIEAMYWYAVNLSKWSRAKGLAALLGNKDRVKGVVERVRTLDEKFFYGAPHRYFGAYWSLLPVGRDLDASRKHFDTSLSIAPHYVGTKVLMAETYAVKKQDRKLFDQLISEVLATPDNIIDGLEPETRVEKEKARELKAKADELF